MSDTATKRVRAEQRQLRRVVAASLVGTTIEFYDFFIYGTAAALVFGGVFFPALGSSAATVAAFATFSVAFFARPLGSIIFGHLGDRIGRKTSLTITLVIMGAATFAIGLLPSAAMIGVAAPIILVTLRFVQGIAVGGEFAGAALLVTEYAPPKRRGLYGSTPQVGAGLGSVLAVVTFLVTGLAMSSESFETWGWRIPFLLSGILVAVGLYIRLKIEETPIFTEAIARDERVDVPLKDLLTYQWREVLLGAGAILMWSSFFYISAVFLVSYGTTELGLSRTTMLMVNLGSSGVFTVAVVIPSLLSDRIGRKRMVLIGNAIAIPWALVLFPILNIGTAGVVFVAAVISMLIVSIANGPTASLLPELFATRYRTTGVGVAYNLGSVLAGAIPPVLGSSLMAAYGSYAISVMLAVYAIVATLCALALRETRGIAMNAPETTPADMSAESV
ncbi:MFS transporter [Rhodococcus wratislaviensis]|uniref:MFS transporter n=1 Tax=Rhodococcus wratislaviensis TaxID=44752 RepID=UPI000F57AF98|nr:MFS transporter [Rhodococcus wratislaviensis]